MASQASGNAPWRSVCHGKDNAVILGFVARGKTQWMCG
ncbi:hypothetical protein SNOG_14803 [Parastagonospora nodorum SN15]|uniref:Uncharacterized protein n=2 Tax=Phaeosphaeria nodorum (strain SN15 / ATCC MYA-4574 / FGSC 10173) TaxID=321614 RepID=A0A7U2NQ15_PHANO|nr:hypothetical protein SNOG_14803 [Parastagonospora nodorum SN15]EAT77995.1 hypothetical protein SNOG_14803 [Parastagonospora nodorum SN15]QRD06240.1 hypothetical protein JI435_148030 [Parastagonospora nodorum SN15]